MNGPSSVLPKLIKSNWPIYLHNISLSVKNATFNNKTIYFSTFNDTYV